MRRSSRARGWCRGARRRGGGGCGGRGRGVLQLIEHVQYRLVDVVRVWRLARLFLVVFHLGGELGLFLDLSWHRPSRATFLLFLPFIILIFVLFFILISEETSKDEAKKIMGNEKGLWESRVDQRSPARQQLAAPYQSKLT